MATASPPRPETAGTELPPLTDKDLDPLLLQIGALVGLLTDQGDGTYTIDASWFDDPWQSIEQIPSQRAAQLLALLETLVGSAAPEAIGQPRDVDGLLWYPLLIPGLSGGTADSPLYLVGPAADAKEPFELGIGARYAVHVEGVAFSAYAYLPLLQLGGGSSAQLVLGTGLATTPAQIGLELTGAGLAAGDVRCDGLRFRCSVALTGGTPQLDLVFLQLQLPGQATAADQTLAAVIALGAGEWIATALTVLANQLATLVPVYKPAIDRITASALALLGITPGLPGLDWDELFKDPQTALLDWAGAIAATDPALKTWMAALAGLLDPTAPPPDPSKITGAGTRADPFSVAIASVDAIAVCLTAAVEVDDAGARHLFPGFAVGAVQTLPAPLATAAAELAFAAEVADLVVPTPTLRRELAALPHLPLPSLTVTATLRNADAAKPLFSVADPGMSGASLSLGSGVAGLRFDGAEQSFAPLLELRDVATGLGAWPVVDFSSAEQIVNQAADALAQIVTTALDDFLGLSQLDGESGPAAALAAVLGLAAPSLYEGTWPVPLLLSGDGIQAVIADPLGALAGYYAQVLTAAAPANGPAPVAALLGELAILMGSSAPAPQGSGTLLDPWTATLVDAGGGLTARLSAWSPAKDELRIGIVAAFALDLSEATVTAELELDALDAILTSGATGARWLPGVAAAVVTTGPGGAALKVPEVGGIALSATRAGVSAGWSRPTGSWFALVEVDGAELDAGTVTVPLGSLVFDVVPQAWTTAEFEKLAGAALALIGLWLLEHGGRAGVALTTLLGLLPDLPAVFEQTGTPFPLPADFRLPAPWPALKMSDPATFFTAPWQDVRAQLAAVLGTPATGQAATTLVGWALTGNAVTPATTPAGTWDDPFTAALGGSRPAALVVWTIPATTGGGLAGAGAGFELRLAAELLSAVAMSSVLRLDVLAARLGGAALVPAPPVPALALSAVLAGPAEGAPLIDDAATGLRVGSAQLGASVTAAGVVPVATFLDATPGGGIPPKTVDVALALESSLELQRLGTLVGALFALLSTQETGSRNGGGASPLQAALDVLAALELAGPAQGGGTGVVTSSWTALLADPGQYASSRLAAVLGDPAAAQTFLTDVAALLGLKPAQAGAGVRCVMTVATALGLGVPSAAGPLPSPQAILAVLADPVGAVRVRAEALFTDPAALKAAVSGLIGFEGAGPLPLPVPGLTASVDASAAVTVATSATALGAELSLAGSITFDPTGETVASELLIGSATAGVAVALSASVSASAAAWELALTVPERQTPAPFAPLRLIGSAGGVDPAVAVVVPTLAISSVATALLNGFVLPASPLASKVAVALGLADGEPARVGSLAGAIMHPASWLDGVLGDGTSVDLTTVGTVLAKLAAGGVDGPGTIKLEPAGTTGAAITGLPYGVSLTLGSTADGLTLSAALGETLGGVDVTLAPSLTYAPPAGVSVGGTAQLKGDIGTHALAIATGYTAGAFSLSATAEGSTFALVPFGGLNQYVEGASAALLQFVAEELLKVSRPQQLDALVQALSAVAKAAGITTVAELITAARAIVADPLQWLGGLEAGGPALASAISALLSGPLGVANVSAGAGLVTYAPAIGDTVVQAKFGFDAQNALGVWVAATATATPLVFTAGAGAAVTLGQTPAFDLSATGGLAIKIEDWLPVSPELNGAIEFQGGTPSFMLQLLPCGPVSAKSEQPALELLPQFALTTAAAPTTAIPLARWLEDAAFAWAFPVLGSAVLNVPAVTSWLTAKLVGDASVASIAAELGVLEAAAPPLLVTDPRTAFGGLSAEQAVAKVAGTAIGALKGLNLLPASLSPASIMLTADTSGTVTTYGLQAALPGVVISGADGKSTKVTLQLGAWPTGDDTPPHWIQRSLSSAPDAEAPGVDIALVSDTGGTLAFAPSLALVSVGLDVGGAGTSPLAELAGCSLGGFEARLYAAIQDGSWYGGALLRADDLAIPLGPRMGSGSNANPIAENLLSSDSGDGNGKGPAVNPAFSVQLALVEPGGTFDLALLGDQPGDTPTHLMIPIQRSLGPLYCQQVVLDWTAAKQLGVGFDGSVSLAGLAVGVQGLEVYIPVTAPLDYSGYGLGLEGLEIAFDGGAVTIDGGLLRTTDKQGNTEYTGGLSVQAEQFGLTVLGSYTLVDGRPSLFAFGLLAAPIGGPPFFFVTGIAAGFGYNRELILPGQDEVITFPLVAGVIDPDAYFPNWKSQPGTALEALDRWIPPKAGEYWLAAGVQFTTFELLQSYALLAVEFGTELAVALFGVSTLQVPSAGADEIPPIAKATLALEAVFKPSSGTFSLTAVLTPDSYLLDPDAHLTGGFAFEIWWEGEHAGQFVLTVGGYSPRFEVPAFFPQEQRLGLTWSMGPVQLTGGVYFALTPSAVMAGGQLSLTYQEGNLRAWLDASADILVRWKPFAFTVDISISIGASYRVDFWFIHHTFSIELGASLELHGMPIGGRVGVHWYVISFSIGFGQDAKAAPPLDWPTFEASFLPKGADAKTAQVVGGAVTAGLMKTVDDANTWWMVGQRFALTTTSLIPSAAATFNGTAPAGTWATQLGVRPMQVTTLASSHTVTLVGSDGQQHSGNLTLAPVTGNLPAALWSPEPQVQAQPDSATVEGALTGMTITAATQPVVTLSAIPLSDLQQEAEANVTWAPPPRPAPKPYSRAHVVEQIETALTSAAVAQARAQLIAGLQPTCPQVSDGAATVLARFADQALQAAPTLVPLGAEPTADTGAHA